MILIDSNLIKDQNRSTLIEIVIVDSNLSLDFESDRNRQSNSDFRFHMMKMIQFVTPNRISLMRMRTIDQKEN